MANVQSEKLMLAGFIQHPDTFFEYGDHLAVDDLTSEAAQMTFEVIRSLLIDKEAEKISKAKIMAEARSLGYANFNSVTRNGAAIDDIMAERLRVDEVSFHFLEVKRQAMIRGYVESCEEAKQYLTSTTDSLSTIIGKVEDLVVSNADLLDQGEHSIKPLPDSVWDFIDGMADDPGHMGFDLGLPVWTSRVGQVKNGSLTFVVATAKCLAGDSLVYNVNDGTHIPIKSLVADSTVLTFDETTLKLSNERVNSHIKSTKKKRCYKLTTRLGYEITCSSDHPFYTSDGWKKLKRITDKDRVLVPTYLASPLNPKNIFTIEESYILGALFGDGCLGHGTPVLSNSCKEIVNKTRRLCKKSGYGFHNLKHKDENRYSVCNGGIELVKRAGINCNSTHKTITDEIHSLCNDRLAAFLGGLWDTDGSVLKKSDGLGFLEVSITLASKKAISCIQKLLLRFGVWTRMSYKLARCNGKEFDSWRLLVQGRTSINRFSIISEHMVEPSKISNFQNFEKYCNEHRYRSHSLEVFDRRFIESFLGYNVKYRSNQRISKQHLKLFKETEYIANSEVMFDSVDSVEDLCVEEYMYDLNIQNNHNFVVNNIFLKNSGKSQFGLRQALTVAHKYNLPVLLVDSELNKSDQQIRMVGMLAKVPYEYIETGYWRLTEKELKAEGIEDESKVKHIVECGERLRDPRYRKLIDDLPLDYFKVSGMGVQEAIPYMRRWLLRKVKPSPDAKFPQCLIVYDYIKLSSLQELQGSGLKEYQLHGLNVSALHDFVNKYHIPMITFGQTNREIDDSFDCVAGAKRIVENVTSISLYKRKTDEELGMDPNGSHLMRVLGARFGAGTEGGYINLQVDLSCGDFTELGMGTVNFADERARRLEEFRNRRRNGNDEE